MAHLIRRRSMERLELYDLDKFSTNYQLSPPPLPPPRIPHNHRRPSMDPSWERYQFLCNMARSKTDPIYAATPMFTTIPSTSKEKPHRQLLGSYIRLENVKPLPDDISKSPEPKKIEIIIDANGTGEVENDNDEEKENTEEKNDDDDDNNQFSGSGSDSDDEENQAGGGGGGDDDDNNTKGIVEQIFNRDKKD